MSDLVKRLRIKAGMIEMGEMIAWGSDSALMREAANALEMAAPAVHGEPLRYTNDGALAECPCCGSTDVGGAHDTVSCYSCDLTVTKPRPLQNAIDAWNTRTGRTLGDCRPDELARVLARAAKAADASVLSEPIQAETLRQEYGEALQPLFALPCPPVVSCQLYGYEVEGCGECSPPHAEDRRF